MYAREIVSVDPWAGFAVRDPSPPEIMAFPTVDRLSGLKTPEPASRAPDRP